MAAGSAGHLLGAHVVGRAQELAGAGQSGGGQQVGVGGAGHAEVEDLRLPGLLHQDVGGLEVAVDDAPVVGVLHRVADPRHQAHTGGRGRGLAVGVLVQGQAADELHGEERLAVVGEAGLVDLRDAGVVQPGQDLGLVGEALEQGGGGQAGADDLEGHRAARVVLLCLVDGAHAAFAEQAEDAIVGDAQGGRRQEAGGTGRASRPRSLRPPSAFLLPDTSRVRGAHHRAIQEGTRASLGAQPGVVGQQPLDLGAEAGVIPAGGVQQGAATVRRQVGRLVEESLDAVAHGVDPLDR